MISKEEDKNPTEVGKTIRLRRGRKERLLDTEWKFGEPLFCTDTKELMIGLDNGRLAVFKPNEIIQVSRSFTKIEEIRE